MEKTKMNIILMGYGHGLKVGKGFELIEEKYGKVLFTGSLNRVWRNMPSNRQKKEKLFMSFIV